MTLTSYFISLILKWKGIREPTSQVLVKLDELTNVELQPIPFTARPHPD